MAAGYLIASFATTALAAWSSRSAISFVAFNSLQGPALAVPTQFLAGRAAAAGIAAMNTITMFSGFVGPYWMGVMKDPTGSYLARSARADGSQPCCGAGDVCADAQSGAQQTRHKTRTGARQTRPPES